MAKKSDTDKDLLFSKLLPALNNNPFSSTFQGAPEEEAPPADTISALRDRLFARGNIGSRDTFVTINIMENLIPKYIDQAIRRFNACSCDRCRCEVAAQALNNIPPKYVAVNPKTLDTECDAATTKVIMDALVNAVIYVRSHPKH